MEDILVVERQTSKFRLLAVLAVVAAGLVAGSRGVDALALVILAVGYLSYLLLLRGVILPRWAPLGLVYPMIVVDAVALGCAIHLTGGAGSLLFVLLPLVIPYYAVYAAYPSALVAATAMLVVYVAVHWIEGQTAAMGAALPAQIPLFYLLAALSGYLAQGRMRRLEEQEALQRLIRLENGAKSLAGAARTIQEASDLGTVLQEMADCAPRLTGLPACHVAIFDRKSGALVSRATSTDRTLLGVERLEDLVEWPRPDAIAGEATHGHVPVAVAHVEPEDERLPAWARRLKVEAMLAVPLVARGVDVGVIYYYGVPAGHRFSAEEVLLAQTFADMVALAAVNAQLYEDVQSTVAEVLGDLRPVAVEKERRRRRKLTVIEVGDLTVDIRRRQARIDSQVVNLTPTEFDLLAVLAENPGRAVDPDALLRRVWGDDYRGRSTVVDVGMHRLRRKIESDPGTPRRIVTVRGSGYMLVPGTAASREREER